MVIRSLIAIQGNNNKRMYQDYDYYFNFALVGPSSVGKSSIIERYVNGVFDMKTISTIGYDFRIKELKVDSHTIKLQIYDTAGQQRYRSVASSYLKNAHAVFLVFDITNKNSFQQLKKVWMGIVNDQIKQDGVLIVLGNKCDNPTDEFSDDQVEYLKENQLKYYKTSAMKGTNIEEMIKETVRRLIEKQSKKDERASEQEATKVVKLKPKEFKESKEVKSDKKCC